MMESVIKNNEIPVLGYWHNNLGDDLFLKILADRYRTQKFCVFISESNYEPFKNIQNMKKIWNHSCHGHECYSKRRK